MNTQSHSEIAVTVDSLHKRYGQVVALESVSFEIRTGEILALLGPNGAGKSTTIEILEGYRTRTGGDVRVLGADPATAGRSWRAALGIVLQSSGIPEQMTVAELVSQFACYYPAPRSVAETIAAVGLTEQARTRVSALSGGQKRRVDVALGIIGNPQLLFLDEPTTGFDPEARRHFWALIEQLRAEGTTILLTTHYLDEAAHLGDRAIVINHGRVVAEGAIDELGGPAARVPLVRWRDADGEHEVRTEAPSELVASLHRQHGELPLLEVVRPSLEDIYLSLLGANAEEPDSNLAELSANSPTASSIQQKA